MRSFVTLAAVLSLVCGAAFAAPMTALIVDGQNNHDWQATTPVLENILEQDGLFTVDVATSPAKGQTMDGFKPNFAGYDVVVLNYNGDPWTAEANAAFLDYVRNGGAVVVYHAADNAFGDWKEYNEIIGVGGWGGRNETSGPMLRWRDGRLVRDTTPGKGGQHPAKHDFQVVIRDPNHPITKGLPEKWMHNNDELYITLRGPAENLAVLATAYCDPNIKNGTGENEPMLMTITYGKGRIFHTTLGHAPEQMTCVGFIVTLRRGAEWAVTGKVEKTKEVPADFPTAEKTSMRPNIIP